MLPAVGGQKTEISDSREGEAVSSVRRVPWHVWNVTREKASRDRGKIYHFLNLERHDPFPKGVYRWPATGCRRLVLEVKNVVSDEAVKNAMPYLRKYRSERNFVQQTSGYLSRVDLLGGEVKIASSVSFDAAGRLQNNRSLQDGWRYYDMHEAVKTLVREAIESMATRVGWADVTVPLFVFLLKYRLTAKESSFTGAPWHRDRNSLTMTVLLSPYRSGRLGFYGGNLSIGQRAENESYFRAQRLADLQTTIPSQTQIFDYSYRDGFIFDNLGSEHKVHDMHLYNPDENPDCTYERWLLSIFSDPEAKDVLALADVLKDESSTRFLPDQAQS